MMFNVATFYSMERHTVSLLALFSAMLRNGSDKLSIYLSIFDPIDLWKDMNTISELYATE